MILTFIMLHQMYENITFMLPQHFKPLNSNGKRNDITERSNRLIILINALNEPAMIRINGDMSAAHLGLFDFLFKPRILLCSFFNTALYDTKISCHRSQ